MALRKQILSNKGTTLPRSIQPRTSIGSDFIAHPVCTEKKDESPKPQPKTQLRRKDASKKR